MEFRKVRRAAHKPTCNILGQRSVLYACAQSGTVECTGRTLTREEDSYSSCSKAHTRLLTMDTSKGSLEHRRDTSRKVGRTCQHATARLAHVAMEVNSNRQVNTDHVWHDKDTRAVPRTGLPSTWYTSDVLRKRRRDAVQLSTENRDSVLSSAKTLRHLEPKWRRRGTNVFLRKDQGCEEIGVSEQTHWREENTRVLPLFADAELYISHCRAQCHTNWRPDPQVPPRPSSTFTSNRGGKCDR